MRVNTWKPFLEKLLHSNWSAGQVGRMKDGDPCLTVDEFNAKCVWEKEKDLFL